MYSEMSAKYSSLKEAGKTEEANALKDAFSDASAKWGVDIINAPEGSPDILFSDYFSL